MAQDHIIARRGSEVNEIRLAGSVEIELGSELEFVEWEGYRLLSCGMKSLTDGEVEERDFGKGRHTRCAEEVTSVGHTGRGSIDFMG